MDSKIFNQEHLTRLNLLQHTTHRYHTLKTKMYDATNSLYVMHLNFTSSAVIPGR